LSVTSETEQEAPGHQQNQLHKGRSSSDIPKWWVMQSIWVPLCLQ